VNTAASGALALALIPWMGAGRVGRRPFFLVHRHFPGKACLILRKKYELSLYP